MGDNDDAVWEYLLEFGTDEELYEEVQYALAFGHPVPIDVTVRLAEAGYILEN